MTVELNYARSKGDKFRFTAGEALVFRIPEKISTSEWAERHRIVVDGGRKSPWRNDLSPCAVGIMDALDLPYVREVYVQAPPQTVKTQSIINYLMRRIDQAPTSAMLVMPNEKLTKRIMRRRVIPSIKSSPRTLSVMSSKMDDTTNLSVAFINGMDITGAWAGSASALSSDAMELMILDEMNKYEAPTTAEPDAFVLARARTNSFPHTYKIYGGSTPTDETGLMTKVIKSRADEIRYYYVKCPLCGEEQRMTWDRITWGSSRDPREILRKKLARYLCRGCGMAWDDSMRDKAVQATMLNGWRAEIPVERPRCIAFMLQSWYCQSMSEAAAAFVDGQGDREKLRAWVTQHCAEEWKETYVPKKESVILALKTKTPPLVVPAQAIALTCGIDTQKYNFWFTVRAWAEDLTSWLIQYGQLQSWADLENLIWRTEYKIEDSNRTMAIWRAGIDTGGGETDDDEISRTEEVYQWIRSQPPIGFTANGEPLYRVYGTKGASHVDSLHAKRIKVSRIDVYPRSSKPIVGGLELRLLDTFAYKALIHWRIERPEGEKQRFLLHAGTGEDYARQLLGEEMARDRKGKRYWKKRGANHLLDCEVIAASCADSQWLPSLQMMANYIKQAAAKQIVREQKQEHNEPDRRSFERPNWLGQR